VRSAGNFHAESRTPAHATHLCEKIWDSQREVDTNLLDVYMSRLRAKLEADSSEPFFRTIRGVGYKFQ